MARQRCDILYAAREFPVSLLSILQRYDWHGDAACADPPLKGRRMRLRADKGAKPC